MVYSKPIGRIDYLHTDGRVRESIEYTSPYKFEKDINEENQYGVPMHVFLYKQADGSVIPHDYIAECDPPLNGFSIIESPYIKSSPDITKEINQEITQERMTKDVNFKYEILENNTVKITKYLGYAKDVLIPEEIDGCKVTSIGSFAFENCTSLKSIKLPDSITKIGNHAFNNCESLKNVKIGNNVKEIEVCAFANCKSLKHVSMGNKIERIEAYAFSNCKSLKEVLIPKNITHVGDYAFDNRTNIQRRSTDFNYSRNFDGTLKITEYLGDAKDVVIPEEIDGHKVTSIGAWAFENCKFLESIELPDSITSIGNSSFEGCTSLKHVEMGANVETIKHFAFSECISLEKITIPDSVTYIGDFAFENCSSLKSITIPEGSNDLSPYAFDEKMTVEFKETQILTM